MNPSKSPGLDGLTEGFYQDHSEVVKEDVVNICLEFLNSNKSLECVNDTPVALVPKVQKPESVENFRPISLCNVIYKVVSKCLSNRLKISLDEVITENRVHL